MTSESKLRDETVRHRHSGAAEFLALAEELGIDPGAMVDPRTELSFAMARRKCSTCPSKEECRQALRQRVVTLSEVALSGPLYGNQFGNASIALQCIGVTVLSATGAQ